MKEFDITWKGQVVKVSMQEVAKRKVYMCTIDSKRVFLTKAEDYHGEPFWTLIPANKSFPAEEIGKLIDGFLSKKQFSLFD
jgi:hypothetical protein